MLSTYINLAMENAKFKTNQTESMACQGVPRTKCQPSMEVYISAGLTVYLSIPNCLIAALGNFLVIYTITTCKQLRTPSNILLLGLSIFDFLVGVVAQPLYIISRVYDILSAENNFSHVVTFITYMCVGCSCLILILVNVDRVFAVASPVKRKR